MSNGYIKHNRYGIVNKKKPSKYKNISCKCTEGHIHDSRDEARYCEKLQLLLKAGEITEIKRQPHFDLCVNDKKIVGHRPDWIVTYPDGHQEIEEFKGFATREWVIQRKLFEAIYPEIQYNVRTKKDLW